MSWARCSADLSCLILLAPMAGSLKELYSANSGAIFAFTFLVVVGVAKTLLTKLVFTHSPTPVAFSVLSCIATNVCLIPILIYQNDFRMLSRKQLSGFAGICVAIALDLGCQNVALAILSIALQQCIKATLPTATVVVESIIRRKRFHPAIYATVAAICIGPILVAWGETLRTSLIVARLSQDYLRVFDIWTEGSKHDIFHHMNM